MPLNQGQVGPQVASDLGLANIRADNYGSQMVQEFNGKYAELARRGMLFNAKIADAGIALIVSATTGNHPTLWNPLGSGKIVYILRLYLNWLSGNIATSGLLWCTTTSAGANKGTGAPVVTFTEVATVPSLVGSSSGSNCKWAPAVCTFAAAPALYMSTGINLAATTAAAATTNLIADYDGHIALLPGTAISLTCAQATTTALFQGGIVYAELPLAPGNY